MELSIFILKRIDNIVYIWHTMDVPNEVTKTWRTTMNHSTSKRTAKAMPQVESTMLVEGTDAKIIKCTARKAFTVGNASIKEQEVFFLVKSERRENRYYVVHFS